MSWYVVQTRSNHEALVETGLKCRGLETFLPRIAVPSRRRDRSRLLEAPLFPGYLFVCADLQSHLYYDVLKHRGVVRILGSHGRVTPVPPDTIHAIHTFLESGRPLYCHPRLEHGMQVRIAAGPLRGASGVILRQKQGRKRLVVSIALLGWAIAVDLDEDAVEPYQ